MKDTEFEKLLKDSLHINDKPNRTSFAYMLSQIEAEPVTESDGVRYTKETATSNIISNKISDIVSIWKSKRIILIPSLIILLFISTLSLSPRNPMYSNTAIQKLAENDALIDESDYDDQAIVESFEEPDINELSIINYEL